MAKVELKDLVKTYNGTTTVLNSLNVEVPDGSFMVMVGPSGCGKSTALRCVAGLEEVTSGHIYIGNNDVTEKEPKDRNIAMVFQNYALYPHMSVLDNITYGLKVRGVKKEERVKRAKIAAELLNLEGLLERMPRQLSGGQRQRVAMGRALVREPSVFLFDEPLSNLDANLRNQMRIELRKLHSRLGTTSLYVTHDQVEAMTLADKILVMRAGNIEQYGTPDEIYMKPASVFVAKFMGFPAMNTLAASIHEGKVVLSNGSILTNVLPKGTEMPGNSAEVLLGVRSEDLIYDPNGPISLSVDIIETLGPDTLVHCFVHMEGMNKQYAYLSNKPIPVIVRFEGSVRPSSGEVLRLSLRPGHGHLFDAKTKLRIA